MKTKSTLIEKHPIVVFVLLSFLISHLVNPIVVEAIHILFPNVSFSFPPAGLSEKNILNQYGGTIAAIIIVLRLYGINGLRSIFRFSKIRTHTFSWLLIAVLLPLLMILLSYILAGVSVAALFITLQNNLTFYLLITGGFILSAGLAEEFGWRGFLLPQLLKKWSPVVAVLITFAITSIWHFPALIAGWKGEPLIPWLILSFAITVIHSWLFLKSNANLWVVVAFHACFDAQYSFYSHFFRDGDLPNSPFHQGWTYVILYTVLALTIILTTRGTLGYRSVILDPDKYFGALRNLPGENTISP